MYQTAAKQLGLPVEQVRSAMYYAEKRLAVRDRIDGKWILRYETRLSNAIARDFKVQMKFVIDELRNLSYFQETEGVKMIDKKNLDSEINALLGKIPMWNTIILKISSTSGLAMTRAAKSKSKKHPEIGEAGISFSLDNPEAVKYLEGLRSLHLSNYKGSIKKGTDEQIRETIAKSVREGRTYTETAQIIEGYGKAGVFSPTRAFIISVDQIAKAYAHGQKVLIDDFIQTTAAIMEKAWTTVRDGKEIDGICDVNEAKGWIGWNEIFPSGDSSYPAHIGCRCDLATRIVRIP